MSGTARRWAGFLLGLALIWAFVFVLAPWLQKADAVRPLAEYVRETGIDASALYYTEVQETGEAEMNIRDTFKYRPSGP